jgi:arylsulfatase
MSGRHEFKNGVTHTINERERMSLKTTTLAQVLKSVGYTTGIFGKWHLGDEEPYQPHHRGFDEVFIHGAGGIGQTYVGSCGDAPNNTYFNPAIRHNGTFVKTQGYCTDLFFAQASKWIDATRSNTKSPFFAYITPNAPHGPLISPGPQYDKLYEGQEIGGKKLAEGDIAYYSMITNIDENIGKLLAQLKERSLEGDTLVIFLSDNGGTHTRLFSGGYRAGKGSMYSGGTHAPSFWRWPGKLAAGRDSSALSAHLDLLPTLAEIAGAPLNDALRQQVEGRSLVPLLANPQADWPDRTLVTHVGRWEKGQAAQAKHKNSSIRDSRFRLVENKELFDLRADYGETTNVIDQHPEVVAKLRTAYDAWWVEVQPLLVNEDAVGPKVNPFKELYWKQFGGGPDDVKADAPKTNPARPKANAAAKTGTPPEPLGIAPTMVDVAYGKHPKQVLHFWKAESDKPAPLLFFIHGGGWQGGNRTSGLVALLPAVLKSGISVVSIEYRFIQEAIADGVTPPVKGPLHDAARALQFVRSQAREWNIDKQRIGASGGSAGACSSLWLAFHDDLADPTSDDPVARESTRLFCAAVSGAQTTLDPQQMKEWTPNSNYGSHAFGIFKKVNGKDVRDFDTFLAQRDKILPWIQEYSPYALVTADDPPIHLFYNAPPALGQDQKDPTHTSNFGIKLQEKLRSVGVPCELVYPGAPDVKHPRVQDYLIEILKSPEKP